MAQSWPAAGHTRRRRPSLALDLPTYAQGQSPYASTRFHYPADSYVPIGCGGVAVLPGDLLIGDGEGVVVVVVPRAVAESVVEEAFEHDRFEVFIMAKIKGGASILGVDPPDAETLREYENWKARNGR